MGGKAAKETTTILIPKDLAKQIDTLIKDEHGCGFLNRSEFCREAIREKVEQLRRKIEKNE